MGVIAGAETSSVDFDDLRAVEKAVEHGGSGGGFMIEDAGPLAEDEIGGKDDGGAALVAFTDDLKKEVSALLVDRQKADFIYNQE